MAIDYRRRSSRRRQPATRRERARRRAAGRWRGVILLAALAGVALTARLGVWQLDRAAQKIALQATLDARGRAAAARRRRARARRAAAAAQHHRRVRLAAAGWPSARSSSTTGRWTARPASSSSRRCGSTAAASGAGAARLGAAQLRRSRTRCRRVSRRPAGSRSSAGIAPPPARLLRVRRGRERADPAKSRSRRRSRARPGSPLLPLSVMRRRDRATVRTTACERQWPPPAIDVQKHHGYAFQWFALAALIAVLYVWFQLIRPRQRRRVA